MTFNELYLKADRAVADYLDSIRGIPSPLIDAMKYSVKDGGKRLRPIMTLIGSKTGTIIDSDILKFAVAVELIHSYSLIHDDLPCMDNDSLRRGKETAHIRYGEAMALLAGDALLNQAFEILTDMSVKNKKYAQASAYIAKMAGGMIGGQCIDITADRNIDTDQIIRMYSLKTACLFKAALSGGAIAAGADKDVIDKLQDYAEYLGIAYQIADDILDITGSDEVLGKNTYSDENNSKPTIVKVIGLDKALNLKTFYEEKAYIIAESMTISEQLIEILNLLINREK